MDHHLLTVFGLQMISDVERSMLENCGQNTQKTSSTTEKRVLQQILHCTQSLYEKVDQLRSAAINKVGELREAEETVTKMSSVLCPLCSLSMVCGCRVKNWPTTSTSTGP